MKTGVRVCFVAASLLLPACSQMPPTHFYVLELQRSAEVSAASGEGWDLGVRNFMVDAPYDQGRIVYRVGERSPEIHFYAYHQWAAQPAQMLADAVAAGLAGAAGVRSVEPLMPGRPYDAYIEGRVSKLEEIDRPGEQLVRIDLDLRLVSRQDEELWSEALRLEGSTETTEVVVVVERMNAILQQAIVDLRPRLVAALSAHAD